MIDSLGVARLVALPARQHSAGRPTNRPRGKPEILETQHALLRAVVENTEIALPQICDGRIVCILRDYRDFDDPSIGLENGILLRGERYYRHYRRCSKPRLWR